MLPYINVFGKTIPSYGVCMLSGVVLALFLAIRRGKRYGVGFDSIVIVATFAFLFGMLGGKLLYLLVSYPHERLISQIKAPDFSFLTQSGIVFYGGLIFGIGGALIGKSIAKTRLSSLEGCIVPFIPLGHAVGRVGCFLAGCCFGIEYSGPLAVCYPEASVGAPSGISYFPVQLLEAFLDVLIMLLLLYYTRRRRERFDVLSLYLILYSVMRFVGEFLRGDGIRGIYFGFSTSQLISLGLIAVCLIRFALKKRKR